MLKSILSYSLIFIASLIYFTQEISILNFVLVCVLIQTGQMFQENPFEELKWGNETRK